MNAPVSQLHTVPRVWKCSRALGSVCGPRFAIWAKLFFLIVVPDIHEGPGAWHDKVSLTPLLNFLHLLAAGYLLPGSRKPPYESRNIRVRILEY